MSRVCFVCWVTLLVTGLLSNQAEAQPKVYAYCVELGAPGVKTRPVGELTKLVKEMGYDGIGFPILGGPELDETLRASDEAGLGIYILHIPIELRPDGAHYDSKAAARISELKGRPVSIVITLDGLKPGDPAGMEPAVRALRELGDLAARADVRISLYNHVDCWNESLEQNIQIVKNVNHPRVGYNFNVSHWVKVDGAKDYRPLLRANADKLFVVLICGSQLGAPDWTDGLVQPLDRGNFDNRALLATLRDIGYQGPVGVMCYAIPGDPRDYLKRSMTTWKSWTTRP